MVHGRNLGRDVAAKLRGLFGLIKHFLHLFLQKLISVLVIDDYL